MHRTTPLFWDRFNKLPDTVQQLARKNFKLLKTNPRHNSLKFKKVGRFWSVRVGLSHRALAVQDDEDFIWGWIGDHEEYDRLVG